MYIIGVDIGATNLKLGLIENSKIRDKYSVPTNDFDVVRQVISEIVRIVEKNNLKMSDIHHIGIGCPGIVIDGIIKESVNLGLAECDIAGIISSELGLKTIVRNDADMATLGEYNFGAGKGTKNMIMLTLGTGVGGGIIMNGRLYTGNGGAGEFGHVTLYKDGIKCNCGRFGCVEKYVSAIALSDKAKKAIMQTPSTIVQNGNQVYASSIVDAFINGDKCAIEIVEEYTNDFVEFLLNLCNIFRPEMIVIGGGITSGSKLIDICSRKVAQKNFGYKNSMPVKIVPALLGNDAGLMGSIITD